MLPRSWRLHTAYDFRVVRTRGRRWQSPSFLAFILPSAQLLHPRVGMIVSGKIGSAVCRKRATRVLRASFAQVQADFPRKLDVVLIARPYIKHKTTPQIARELQQLGRSLRQNNA